MTHHKKCIPSLFDDVRTGKKRFEVRLADFEVKTGDKIVLEEWNSAESAYTGRICTIEIDYILKTKDMPTWSSEKVEEFGFQIMQIKSVE